MSEEDKITLKGVIEYITEKKGASIWDINTMLSNKDEEYKELEKVFSPQQLEVIGAIVNKAVLALEWHNSKDSDAHPNLEEQLSDLAAKFRNHRHETGKTFSAKPEY
jgi:predicted transcriptional regulator